MDSIFDSALISEINLALDTSDAVTVYANSVTIRLDWQSRFLIERRESEGSIVYDLYYAERGDRLRYASYKNAGALKNGILSYCRAYH